MAHFLDIQDTTKLELEYPDHATAEILLSLAKDSKYKFRASKQSMKQTLSLSCIKILFLTYIKY